MLVYRGLSTTEIARSCYCRSRAREPDRLWNSAFANSIADRPAHQPAPAMVAAAEPATAGRDRGARCPRAVLRLFAERASASRDLATEAAAGRWRRGGA